MTCTLFRANTNETTKSGGRLKGALHPFWWRPNAVAVVLDMNKALVRALDTAHVLRLSKADVLALIKAHVLLVNPER